jgi:hypothetical protein
MEKESPKLILAHHAPQIPEGEERNESAKDDDPASQQVVDTYVVIRSNAPSPDANGASSGIE